jgi:inosose dehydratase
MLPLDRRAFIKAAVASVAGMSASRRLMADEPARPRVRPNVLYALSTASWGRVTASGSPLPLLQILDETAAAGFNGVRLTGFPDILKQSRLSVDELGAELARRGLKFSTVSFGGAYFDRDKHDEIRARAREALLVHQRFGAKAMVFFPPSPVPAPEEAGAFRRSFTFMNELGKMAVEEFDIRLGLHNHTDSLIENQAQVDRFLEGTDPRYVFCAWDTAHLHLGGCDVQSTFRKSIDRIVYTDFKDATRHPIGEDYVAPNGQRYAGGTHEGRFFNSIFELGRGEIDFASLMRMLAARKYQGWINHDLDTIRISTADSWRTAMAYITTVLDPIYQ